MRPPCTWWEVNPDDLSQCQDGQMKDESIIDDLAASVFSHYPGRPNRERWRSKNTWPRYHVWLLILLVGSGNRAENCILILPRKVDVGVNLELH